jgi:hypothetical protein
MSPEDRLRFAAKLCGRAAVGQSSQQAIAEEDVPALLALGREHRFLPLLAPLLAPRLAAADAEEVNGLAAAAWASYELTAATLGPLFERAHARGIRLVVYKGAAHAARLYHEPWRRQMQDVDLLVPASDWAAAEDLATSAGYRLIVTPRRSRSVELGYEKTLVHARPGVRMIDLHIAPAPPLRHPFDPARLFARARPAQVFGAPVLVLALEDELVISAVNQAYDHFRVSLLRAVDGALLMARGPVDWAALIEAAGEAQARTATWLTLRWIQEVAGGEVPATVLQSLHPPRGRTVWLSALLGAARPSPRFRFPRRIEQLLLTYPLMDHASTFWSYTARHSARRLIDAWRAARGARDQRGGADG